MKRTDDKNADENGKTNTPRKRAKARGSVPSAKGGAAANPCAGEYVTHPIAPICDARSRILILGSFPSVKSREAGFYYGHPQNRFWRVLASLYGEAVPCETEEKRAFLLSHGIALYDVISACEICGSADASIKKVCPADLSPILAKSRIEKIFVNGRTAEAYYRKYQEAKTGRAAILLPSTSPANATFSLSRLTDAWRVIL